MEPALAAALGQVAEAACEGRDPWWLIGSAAMALHGARPLAVGDIDLLMSRSDAERLLLSRGVEPSPGSADGRFRSDVFGRWQAGSYKVEVMAGFHVRADGRWREVVPLSRCTLRVGAAELFVPSVDELVAMCRLFGREKDSEREQLLLSLDPPRGLGRS